MNSNGINNSKHREAAIEVVDRLQNHGFTAFWAGGCVRDMLLGSIPNDYDIATSALPENVADLFPGSILVGKSFGVVRAPVQEIFFEIATFRQDHSYKDGRRPESVSFSDPETDSARRDFTINSIFYDPVSDRYYDYNNGQIDLKAHIVRCVGNPNSRFADDYLRMLRAVRFASVLEFTLHPDTQSAILKHAHLVTEISAERIRDELTRILLESKHAGDALRLLDKVGLLKSILPEVAKMKGQEQPPEFHPEGDVFNHTVIMLNTMSTPTLALAWSALLHDVGKPVTATYDTDRIRFNCHAGKGADIACKILQRLRFSSADTEAILHCIRNHMKFSDVQKMKQSTLRKMVGSRFFATELDLHRLDCLSSHRKLGHYEFLVKFQDKLANEPVLPEPWINGGDIMRMGVNQGQEIGVWKKLAYDAQLENRFIARDDLADWLREQIRQS
ncbi:MAG: CCA tRNA nucleotidyltransferase [Kiritimatiellae bacterium]|nr:CCA tRNA nucleotidyltransferase [Kiritimatiellia bacterium]